MTLAGMPERPQSANRGKDAGCKRRLERRIRQRRGIEGFRAQENIRQRPISPALRG